MVYIYIYIYIQKVKYMGVKSKRLSRSARAHTPTAVICVLHGISIGLAIDLSCCADVRLCTADTRLAVKEVDIGLAADIGTLARLPKAVGSYSWVKDVCLSARFFGAAEALRVGYVSEVHENKEKAVAAGLEKAVLVAGKSPVAVQGTKELLNHARDHSVGESRSIILAPRPYCPALPRTGSADYLPLQVCGTPLSGTRPCSSRTTSPPRFCLACRRGSRRSRNYRHRSRHLSSPRTCTYFQPQPGA
jgi:hypothetical protein